MSTKKIFEKYFAELTALLILIIYILTLAPGVVEIDAGELATVQATLGIAHPTGYPLFTIVGYLLLKIPIPFSTIYKANFLAAISCALGAWIIIKSLTLVLMNTSFIGIQSRKNTKQKKNIKPTNQLVEINMTNLVMLTSISTGLILAFSKTFWITSTSVEVYSLQIFLFGLIIYTTLRTYYSSSNKLTNWMLFGFVLALGFSNHMTTMLALPFAAILFFQKEKFNSISIKKIFFSLLAFIPTIILFYSYLPVRASSNPILDWGNPTNFENFFRHVSGKQYQVWLFSSLDAAKKHLGSYLENIPAELGYVGLVFGVIGFFYLYKVEKKMFFAILTTFLFSVLYVINYDIVDLASYFLMSYIMFSFFIAFGSIKLIFFIREKYKNQNIIYSAIIVISLLPLVLNYSEADQSDLFIYEDYTRTILDHVEKDAVIFSYQWDYFISASYYFQNVENYRKDVTVIDKELLRRSWYYNQLRRNHPDVIKEMNKEISNFLDAVKPFELNEQFDSNIIENYYRTIMTKLIEHNADKRSYYIGIELFQNEMQRGEFSLPQGYQMVPDLFFFKVVRGNDYAPAQEPNFTIRLPKIRNKYIDAMENFIGNMLSYRALYELQFNKPERAKIYIKKLKKDLPDFQIPYNLETKIN
jgi:hypothetical protein